MVGIRFLRRRLILSGLHILGVGFALGLRHALDADHLIAVTTIVSERKGLLGSSLIGALWGLGHTATLLIVALGMIVWEIQIPGKAAPAAELAVAAMLVALGIRVLWRMRRGGIVHAHVHTHEGHPHVHIHTHPVEEAQNHDRLPEHVHARHSPTGFTRSSRLFRSAIEALPVGARIKSLLVGMMHGLAGSAALMLVVLATIPSSSARMLYITMFGLGSLGGMMVMSTLIGIPFAAAAKRSHTLTRMAHGLAGSASVGFGLFLAWQIGYVEGLLR